MLPSVAKFYVIISWCADVIPAFFFVCKVLVLCNVTCQLMLYSVGLECVLYYHNLYWVFLVPNSSFEMFGTFTACVVLSAAISLVQFTLTQ